MERREKRVSALFAFLILILGASSAGAVEPDWKWIDSFTVEVLPCPAGTTVEKRPFSTGDNKNYRCSFNGPFVDVNKEGRILTKGTSEYVDHQDQSRPQRISREISYYETGLVDHRGTLINSWAKVGTWEYWWPTGAQRARIEFESEEAFTNLLTQSHGIYPGRDPRVISMKIWDETGNPVPSAMFDPECSEFSNSNRCIGHVTWKRSVKQLVKECQNEWQNCKSGIVEAPLDGEWQPLHDEIMSLFRAQKQKIAYSGITEGLILITTIPTEDRDKRRVSYYEVRIQRSRDCPADTCQLVFADNLVRASMNAQQIDWNTATTGDDTITQEIAKMLEQRLSNFEKRLNLSGSAKP